MIARLRRIGDMPAEELSFRARTSLRTQAERLSAALGLPSWSRRGILRALTPETVDDRLRAAVSQEDWKETARLLRARLSQRAGRFIIDPRLARPLADEIVRRWPQAPADAARAASTILAGSHRVLGYPALSFARGDRQIDWHFDPVHERGTPMRFWADVPFLDSRCGDHKIIWEINRQQYFLALGRAFWLTGDRRYAARIIHDIQDWMVANPPLLGANWASMLELGLRSLSWVAALHFLLGEPVPEDDPAFIATADDTWLLDVCLGLDRQLTHVERHLSRYFSPNTHLTGEALALYVVGVALPELKASRRWTQLGKSVLLREIGTQILPDGGHAELSTCYHRYTLDFYSLALVTAELEGDRQAAATFRAAVQRLATYMRAFTAPDGTIPAIGDDDGGQLWALTDRDPRDVRDSLALAALLTGADGSAAADPSEGDAGIPEEALWLAWQVRPAVREPLAAGQGARRAAAGVRVHHLRDSGYIVAHTGDGDRLTFDAGPHGFLNGGHAHADALSITLSLRARPFLVDPGTATYTMNAGLRTRMRESASHNTLTIGGRSSAVPRGPFQWETRATGTVESLTTNPRFMVAEGTHDGYAPAEHRRMIVHGDGAGWLIADYVTTVDAPVDAHWHFDPGWHVEKTGNDRLLATGPTGARAWLLHDRGTSELFHGDEAGGWCSPRYGALLPTFSVRVRHEDGEGIPLVTWIGSDEDLTDPRLERVPLQGPAHRGDGVRLTHRGGTILTVFHPRSVPLAGSFTCAGVTTNARVLQLARSSGEMCLSLVDGSDVAAAAPPLTSVTCSEPVDNLFVRVRDGVADLWTTAPPSSLRLRFAEGHQPNRLRLNGGDAAISPRGDLVIPASSWRPPVGSADSGRTLGNGERVRVRDAETIDGRPTLAAEGYS